MRNELLCGTESAGLSPSAVRSTETILESGIESPCPASTATVAGHEGFRPLRSPDASNSGCLSLLWFFGGNCCPSARRQNSPPTMCGDVSPDRRPQRSLFPVLRAATRTTQPSTPRRPGRPEHREPKQPTLCPPGPRRKGPPEKPRPQRTFAPRPRRAKTTTEKPQEPTKTVRARLAAKPRPDPGGETKGSKTSPTKTTQNRERHAPRTASGLRRGSCPATLSAFVRDRATTV